jgi:hypothetical protein
MKAHDYYDRIRSFSGPIADLGMNNPLVRQIMEQYAHGLIITKEEALSQMVVQLAKDWTELQRRAYEMAAYLTVPVMKGQSS